ncbi:MAG: hypothetical protein ABI444_06240, partial [Candidatus Kapaibacterium sp.]
LSCHTMLLILRSTVLAVLLFFGLAVLTAGYTALRAQTKTRPRTSSAQRSSSAAASTASPVRPMHILGMRPGLSLDSIRSVIASAGATLREISEDSLTQSFTDHGLKLYVVDSIMCRLTYMRMVFLFDMNSHRLRRLSITPRESSIADGRTDDINSVLLLYFGEQWGTPTIQFDPPAHFTWKTGNLEVRGMIKRGYPLWMMEG